MDATRGKEVTRGEKDLVFVVDDSPTIRKVATVHLENLGCSVVTFASGAECLQALEARRPMLILMDLRMEPMAGDECCRRIKERADWAAIPVIMLTAAGQPHEIMYCWRAGASDFLPKPLNELTLAQKVASVRSAWDESPSGALAGVKVLLVEDTRFYRNVIGATLEQAGLHVLYAEGAEDAQQLVVRHAGSIQGMVIDVVLQGSSGIELLASIRKDSRLARTPAVLMSGAAARTAALEAEVKRLTGGPLFDKGCLPYPALLRQFLDQVSETVEQLKPAERIPFFAIVEFSSGVGEWSTAFSQEVSPGGLFLRTLTPAPVGADVELKLMCPGFADPLHSRGEVVWSTPCHFQTDVAAPSGMGVRFTEISAGLAAQLKRLVERRIESA